jgi:hypothetical protein
MKKWLHLKKTKRHWRRKPPKVVSWRDRLDAERAERRQKLAFQDALTMGHGMSVVAAALLGGRLR